MATLPYFVLGPSAALSALGLIRGSDPTVPTPAEDWRRATVDVVIPALNEQDAVVLALASVMRQTLRPRRILLVDDGSTDRTAQVAEAFGRTHRLPLVTIRRRKPIGKTPTIKRQALELDSDVVFILDADTILESENYIERTVHELYRAIGIASACGTILPLGARRRRAWFGAPETRAFIRPEAQDEAALVGKWLRRIARGATNMYREVLYLFLQRFVYRGQMVFWGTTSNPVGCAVAYRRKYVQRLFEHFTPILGDDLTNSEDIFIGLALLNEGYRNIQLTDVYARTIEPPIQRLPKQLYGWSSAFLQSCYYFDPLVRSPLKALRRRFSGWRNAFRRRDLPIAAVASTSRTVGLQQAVGYTGSGSGGVSSPAVAVVESVSVERARFGPGSTSRFERRRIGEPYRQGFGRDRTLRNGRPAGWMLMMAAVEKVFFPTVLLILILLGNWHGLALTVGLESLVGIIVLGVVMKGQRLEYMVKAVLVAPLRYALLTGELFTIGRFAADLWLTKNRRWRK